MIQGCINRGRNANYTQKNNSVERIDGKPLNWCNVTAEILAWAAVTPGFDNEEKNGIKNPWGGSYNKWQPEDMLALFYHDEENVWPVFQAIRPLKLCHEQPHDGMYPPEQIPQYMQAALRMVMGLGADFSFSASFSYVAGETARKVACILRLKSPGHFIMANGYDDEKMLISFKDPANISWLIETLDADGNKWMSAKNFKDNVHSDITRAWRL